MGRWNRYFFNGYYTPSRPREAKGGIKAQSRRGDFGESWWAKRWIGVLESFNIGARLGRGRSYARQGQVLSIHIDKGRVISKVQGSRPKPYNVRIEVKTLSDAEWKKLAESLARQAIFAAKLLAGEMPQNIEEAFQDVKLSLFPRRSDDLKTSCSCPDWSNPCKHIAAVYYLLGEEFDRDSFLIFKLRGIDREEFLGLLGDEKPGKGTAGVKKAATHQDEEEEPLPEPLPSDPDNFWGAVGHQDDFFGEVRVPPVAAALPRRLGKFPLWRGQENFLDALEKIYGKASPIGMEVFLGEASADGKAKSRRGQMTYECGENKQDS